MKKVLILALTFFFTLTVSANIKPVATISMSFFKLSETKHLISLKKLNNSSDSKSPACRVCCTFTVTSSDGEHSISREACAGGLFTSCETAGNTACTRARLAAAAAAY